MFEIDRIIQNALQEDIGPGDLTTLATVEPGTAARAELVAKEDFVLSGIDIGKRVFQLLDSTIAFEKLKEDGQSVERGDVLAWFKGDAAVLLQGERVALNLLQRMSGMATQTARFVRKVDGTGRGDRRYPQNHPRPARCWTSIRCAWAAAAIIAPPSTTAC